MKAIQINAYGHNDQVKINFNAEQPKLNPGQVLIKVHAAGVNPVDWKVREGFLKDFKPAKFPLTLGMDFSGEIIEVGEGVKDFKIGDEVFGQNNYLNGESGTFAEFMTASPKIFSHKPTKLSHIEAGGLAMVGVSAWQALVDTMHLSKNHKILIHGGSGGIGSCAIQIAKYLGAYVATTVSGANQEFVKNLGADLTINYKTQDFTNLIHDYDFVLDTLGGEVYLKSFEVLKKGGLIISMLENPRQELMKKYEVQALIEYTEPTAKRLLALAILADKGALQVPISKVFSLDQAKEALEYSEHGHPVGRVIVRV